MNLDRRAGGDIHLGIIMTETTIEIYRGFDAYFPSGVYKNIFRECPRNPIDTNINMHNIADGWFKEKFNVFARSQTLICSTDFNQAIRYKGESGVLAKIAPIGNYKIIYSEYIKDFLDYAFEIHDLSSAMANEWLLSKNYHCVEDINCIPRYFKGEIMIDCEKFELVDTQL